MNIKNKKQLPESNELETLKKEIVKGIDAIAEKVIETDDSSCEALEILLYLLEVKVMVMNG